MVSKRCVERHVRVESHDGENAIDATDRDDFPVGLNHEVVDRVHASGQGDDTLATSTKRSVEHPRQGRVTHWGLERRRRVNGNWDRICVGLRAAEADIAQVVRRDRESGCPHKPCRRLIGHPLKCFVDVRDRSPKGHHGVVGAVTRCERQLSTRITVRRERQRPVIDRQRYLYLIHASVRIRDRDLVSSVGRKGKRVTGSNRLLTGNSVHRSHVCSQHAARLKPFNRRA